MKILSTKQNNSKILENNFEQDKIDTSAETRLYERTNEVDKLSHSTSLGFTEFVNGVDSYDNIIDQKSKWIMNLMQCSKM